ncbi:MAG: CBS domain-containing protein [Flavobacteriales bacterium]|nr:CBS domain-containing protein [Flavobacteriales bacterium]
MKNSIAERIADFLKNYPPFTSLIYSELVDISKQILVLHMEKNQVLFKVGDQTHGFFYVVKEGAIGLSVNSDAEETLIDKCDEGDILGLRPFFAKNNYLMTAKAREESLIYAIPIEIFKPYVSQNAEVLSFLLESFASNTRNPYDKEHKGKLISENVIYNEQSSEIQYFQPIKYTSTPITSSRKNSVKEVAITMTQHKIGSVIIQENNLPVGIVTDKDLRSKIATGKFSIDIPIEQIMSAPVITVSENISIAETQLIMLKQNVGHLCVTADGTTKTNIIGIISEHDVVVAQANNPGVLLKETKRATRSKELKLVREKLNDLIQNSLDKNIPIQHISNLVGEINIAITKRAVELAIEKMDEQPPTQFAWMNIGSQGRKEQLLMTDQDNALIFDDVEENRYDNVKKYFVELAEKVTKTLNKIGYEFCPAEMMASNPMWCKSVTDWNKQYNSWINKPGEKGILMCSIFFDYDFIYGDENLVNQITENIFANIHNNQLFYAYLGTDALKNPPPLGFFRQFLVEDDGEHKDTFDIKSRALMPLIDAARLLILSQDVKGINNTYQRYKKMAELEPQNADLFESCADAFSTLSHFRTEEGLANNSNGRYLNLNELSKSDKVKLKNAFQPIRDIQDAIKNRFQLTYFT